MTKVNLPPGCYGFECSDGTKYTGKPGGSVDVTDYHADDVNRGQYGQQGFINARGTLGFGTKRGQRCPRCNRVWNAWNLVCPRCSTVDDAVVTTSV